MPMYGGGANRNLRNQIRGRAGIAGTGDPIAFVVRDSTPIDPSTTADAGLGIGANGNGWTALLTFKALSINGNVNAFDGSKVTILVTDPGFDTSGNATTVSRTIKGSVAIRRQWPNNTSRMISIPTTDLQVMFGLDQPIYAATTIVSVTVASGAYPGANALTIPGTSITNSSTRAYPKPLFGWLNRQRERATGASFAVEGLAYHRHARNGQQVACVQYFGKDAAAHTTAVQTLSAPALSLFQTRGNIVESWQATIPLSALDQTAGSTTATNMPFVDAKVYPWIGDSSAVIQLSVDGYAQDDARPMQKLYFVNDKNATYGGAFAYVKSGASGGTVSATAATARAAPFPTVNAAFTAIKTFNNSTYSHNDYGGSAVRLMDDGVGGAVAHQITASIAASPGITYSSIEPDPLNTAIVSLQLNSTGLLQFPTMISFGAVTLLPNAGTYTNNFYCAGVNDYMALEGTTINFSGSSQQIFYNGGSTANALYATMRNVIYAGGTNGNLLNVTDMPLVLGLTSWVSAVQFAPYMFIGNNLTNNPINEGVVSGGGHTYPGHDSSIIANNKLMGLASAASTFGYNFPYSKGMAIVQNVFEILNNSSNGIFNIAADSSTQPVDNILEMHNTVVGNRGNRMYCDNNGAIGQKKRGIKRGCIEFSWPMKSDRFQTDQANANANSTGRVSNWEYLYDVDNFGNCCLAGAANEAGTVNGPADPDGILWQGMWTQPTSTKKVVTEPARTGTPAYAAFVAFTSDRSWFGSNAGNGDYRLTGASNSAYSRVASGLAALKYDLSGVARKNDGNGAAGAFERTDI